MLRGIQELHTSHEVVVAAGTGTTKSIVTVDDEMKMIKEHVSPGVRAIIDALQSTPTSLPVPGTSSSNQRPSTFLPPSVDPKDVIAAITAIRGVQAARDSVLDAADLYGAMRNALRTGDDFAVLEVLQASVPLLCSSSVEC